ncbi:hypothetical protein KG091_02985 [Carnobacteriaceae bacterium zg-ZUI78]|nr:hypothetical protein [Carnobacteriaceae bacterium zg-ZUI78]
MQTGELIQYLRKSKNFSIKDICQDKLSSSSYHRFVKGEHEISFDAVLYLLEHLHVDLDEFLFLKRDYQNFPLKNILTNSLGSYHQEEIQHIRSQAYHFSAYDNDTYHHLGLLCDVILTQHESALYQLKQYLVKVETWTTYEMLLFDCLIPYLDTPFINIVYKNCINGLKRYEHLDQYSHEYIQTAFHLVIFFLHHQDIRHARNIFQSMLSQRLHEPFIFERLHLKFLKSIFLCLEKDVTAQEMMKHVFSVCDFLDIPYYQKRYITILNQLQTVYPELSIFLI